MTVAQNVCYSSYVLVMLWQRDTESSSSVRLMCRSLLTDSILRGLRFSHLVFQTPMGHTLDDHCDSYKLLTQFRAWYCFTGLNLIWYGTVEIGHCIVDLMIRNTPMRKHYNVIVWSFRNVQVWITFSEFCYLHHVNKLQMAGNATNYD